MATVEEVMGTDILHKSDFQETDGDLATITGLENYKEAMIRRWITSPGTLLHRPKYGAGLKDYQNAPATLESKRKMAVRIKEQAFRDPRTEEVRSVSFSHEDETPDKFTIIVSLKPIGYEDTTIEFQPFGT